MMPETASSNDTQNFELSNEFVERLVDLLERHEISQAELILSELHAADLAHLVDVLPSELRPALMEAIPNAQYPEILVDLDEHVVESVISLLGNEASAEAITQLETDDAVSVIEELGEEEQREILAAIPDEQRQEVEEGLSYPDSSAGRLMNRKIVLIPEFWTVGDTIDFLRGEEALPNDFYQMFVSDPKHRPVGGVLVSRVIRSPRDSLIRDIMEHDLRVIPAMMDQEEVAHLFRKYALVSAPVVNEEGRMVGVITLDDIVEVIHEESHEDMMRLGGVIEGDLFSALSETVRHRFPWLLVNLLTAIAASLVIWMFTDTIEAVVALAILMPIVASMGGNAGTQTMTVAVRALATRELSSVNATRVIGKEVLVGAINGLAFAFIAGAATYLWYHDIRLSMVMGIATVVTLTCAGLMGALIPLVMERMKVDPAITSGVFLTTATDMIGFFVFLGVAALVLL